MDDNKFQEIKDIVDEAKIAVVDYPDVSWLTWVVENVPLLIVTLEETWAELVEANECCDRLTRYFEVSEDWKERCHDKENLMKIESDRCDLRKQLDVSYAVNDAYKNMVEVLELTIELLETNGEE